MQGTVFKITHDQIVVLCEDGRFRNQPLTTPAPKLGERITVELNELKELKEQRKKSAVFTPKRWVAAMILALLVISTFTIVDQAIISRTAAMVAIDINPSVEMLIDRKGKVEKLLYVSDDATHLIGERDIVNMNFYHAVNVLVANAELQGLLDAAANETVVMMSIVNKGKDPFQVDLAKIEATEQYDIHIHYATNEEHEQAEQAGLTLNKYYLYEQSKQKGLDLDIEEMRTKSVASLINDAGLEMPSASEHAKVNEEKGKEQRADKEEKAHQGKDKPQKDNPGKGNNGKGNSGKNKLGKDNPGKGNNNGKGNNGNGKGNSGKDTPGKGKPEHADKNKPGKGKPDKGKSDKGKSDKGKPDNDNYGKDNPGKGKSDKGKSEKGKGNNKNKDKR